jgi:hypothetical protein
MMLEHIPNVYDRAFERAFETLMLDLGAESAAARETAYEPYEVDLVPSVPVVADEPLIAFSPSSTETASNYLQDAPLVAPTVSDRVDSVAHVDTFAESPPSLPGSANDEVS